MKKISQAFVLAGGRGERLRPLTDNLPKPLVKVAGKPILEYSIELLALHKVREIILATGYMHEKIENYFGSGEKFDLDIEYSIETEPLGTGGALKQAEEMLDDSFYMLNGDNIADFNLTAISGQHFSDKALGTVALSEVADVSGYGSAKIVPPRMISEFVEKPQKGKEPSKFVNAGAYVLEKSTLEMLPEGFSFIEKTLFPDLAAKRKLFAYIHNGVWLTTDTIERLKRAQRSILEHKNWKMKF